MNAPKNSCYEAGPDCEGNLNARTILGWTWAEGDPDEGRRVAEPVMLCLTHELRMAATEGEVERWLAGRDDWRQPISTPKGQDR